VKGRTLGLSRAWKREPGSWVGARRVALLYVSSRPPFRTARTTFMVCGSTPVIILHGGTRKRRVPCRQFHRYPPVYRLRVHWLPVFPSSHKLGAFALGTHPRVGGFPARRLLRPIRHSLQASGFRPGSPPSYCPLPLASCKELPVFSLEDSHETRQVACSSPCPSRSLRLPSLWTAGRTACPLPPLPPSPVGRDPYSQRSCLLSGSTG
jgi:hypothetical protein